MSTPHGLWPHQALCWTAASTALRSLTSGRGSPRQRGVAHPTRCLACRIRAPSPPSCAGVALSARATGSMTSPHRRFLAVGLGHLGGGEPEADSDPARHVEVDEREASDRPVDDRCDVDLAELECVGVDDVVLPRGTSTGRDRGATRAGPSRLVAVPTPPAGNAPNRIPASIASSPSCEGYPTALPPSLL